ncbi:hypothetical protein D3C83_245520 [compost metagenome]
MKRATATLPMMPPAISAQIRNGTTAMPISEIASSTQIGPKSSSTRSPAPKVVSGRSLIVRAQARTGRSKSRLRAA